VEDTVQRRRVPFPAATLTLVAGLALAACTSPGSDGAASGGTGGDGAYGRYGNATGGAATQGPTASPAAPTGACAPSSSPGQVEVTIEGRAFSSSRITARVGDVISFTNRDAVPHTATLDDGSCTAEGLGKGVTGGLTFTAAGSYPFHCRIHTDMTGTIEVTD
jgi:plastocyanin